MKRYDLDDVEDTGEVSMNECPDGRWVRYSDLPALLREAFEAGAYWGMDNPFGPDTEIPYCEAARRYPEVTP